MNILYRKKYILDIIEMHEDLVNKPMFLVWYNAFKETSNNIFSKSRQVKLLNYIKQIKTF